MNDLSYYYKLHRHRPENPFAMAFVYKQCNFSIAIEFDNDRKWSAIAHFFHWPIKILSTRNCNKSEKRKFQQNVENCCDSIRLVITTIVKNDNEIKC